jgi:hypothetical protein
MLGTNMTITAGTPFYVNGLTLKPATDFTLNNISVTKNEKVTNYLGQATLSRVYKFSNTTSPYIGEASIYYNQHELRSGNNDNLKLELHNGISWTGIPLKINDVNNHYTQSQQFAQSINEITLGEMEFTPTLTIIGNPIINGILKFNINTDSDVSLYSFEGVLVFRKKYLAGIHVVEVPQLYSGTYMLRANELTKTVIIVK